MNDFTLLKIGFNFKIKNYSIDSKNIKLQIWDIFFLQVIIIEINLKYFSNPHFNNVWIPAWSFLVLDLYVKVCDNKWIGLRQGLKTGPSVPKTARPNRPSVTHVIQRPSKPRRSKLHFTFDYIFNYYRYGI